MRVLIQRVLNASVTIEGEQTASINRGLLIFLGVQHEDTEAEANALAKKCAELRIFSDESDKMNLSVQDISGEILVVSQFTLYGTCTKGRRPEFSMAAKGETALSLYQHFIQKLREIYPKVETGHFGADMKIALTNDGPVTLWIEK